MTKPIFLSVMLRAVKEHLFLFRQAGGVLIRPPRSPLASVSIQSLIAWLENSPRGKRVEIEIERESNMDRRRGYKWCTGGNVDMGDPGA